jgi:iron complex transport system ATP-binding protein
MTDASHKTVPGLEVSVLYAGYPGRPVVENVDLTVARLHRPESGTVRAGGDDIWGISGRRAAHRVALLPSHRAHPRPSRWPDWSATADTAAKGCCASGPGRTELAAERLDRLSGGRRQRCWLAMILAQHTPVILLDEPTSALDLGHAVEVLEPMREVAATGPSSHARSQPLESVV